MNKKDFWDGEHYKKNSSPQEQGALKIINEARFTGNENVLDIGCGDGKITAEITQKVPYGQVFGIDASPSMIDQAKKYYSNVGNLSFYVKNATDFCFDTKFDYIFSFFALHWVKNKTKVFQLVFDVLKNNGCFLGLLPTGLNQSLGEVLNRAKWKAKLLNWEDPYHPITQEELKNILINLDFKINKLESQVLSFSPPSIDKLVGWLLGWVPHYVGFNEQNSLLICRDIAEDVAKTSPNYESKGQIEWQSAVLFVDAAKA